jgi:hypothetical protein
MENNDQRSMRFPGALGNGDRAGEADRFFGDHGGTFSPGARLTWFTGLRPQQGDDAT